MMNEIDRIKAASNERMLRHYAKRELEFNNLAKQVLDDGKERVAGTIWGDVEIILRKRNETRG